MQTDSPDRINTNVLNFIRGMVKGEKMGGSYSAILPELRSLMMPWRKA